MEWINSEGFNKRTPEKLQPVWITEPINQSPGSNLRRNIETEITWNNNDFATETPRKTVTKVTKLILKSPPKVNIVRVKSVQTFKAAEQPVSPSFTRSVLTNDISPRKENKKPESVANREPQLNESEEFIKLSINDNKLKDEFKKRKEDREKVTEEFKDYLIENLINDLGSPKKSLISLQNERSLICSVNKKESTSHSDENLTLKINPEFVNNPKAQQCFTQDNSTNYNSENLEVEVINKLPVKTNLQIIDNTNESKIKNLISTNISNKENAKIIRDPSNPIIQRASNHYFTSKSSAMNSLSKTTSQSKNVPSSVPSISPSTDSTCQKRKTYDPIKAREYMKEQQKKRKLVNTKTMEGSKIEKEEIQKRLNELKKTTLKLVGKCQNKTKKSVAVESKQISSRSKNITPISSNRVATDKLKIQTTKSEDVMKNPPELQSKIEKTTSTTNPESTDKLHRFVPNESQINHKILHLNQEIVQRIGILRRPDSDSDEPIPPASLIVDWPKRIPKPINDSTLTKNSDQPIKSSQINTSIYRIGTINSIELNKENIEVTQKSDSISTEKKTTEESSRFQFQKQMIDEELQLKIPDLKLKTPIPLKDDLHVKSVPNKPNIPYWLKPSIAQAYPYNFIMAVRKKLEAITNPTQKAAEFQYCENSVQTSLDYQNFKIPELPKRMHQFNDRNEELLKDIQNISTINKYFIEKSKIISPKSQRPPQSSSDNSEQQSKRTSNSELNTNFSSISLHLPESNTISEVSSIKSESIRNNNQILCSTKINQFNKEEVDDEHEVNSDCTTNSDRTTIGTSFSSVVPSHESSPEKKKKLIIQTDNLKKGSESQISPLSEDNIAELRIRSKSSFEQKSQQKDKDSKKEEEREKNFVDKNYECEKLLEAFNRSLKQVIQVQHQLYSVFKNPLSQKIQNKMTNSKIQTNHQQNFILEVKTQKTQTSPHISNSFMNYSDDFEKNLTETQTNSFENKKLEDALKDQGMPRKREPDNHISNSFMNYSDDFEKNLTETQTNSFESRKLEDALKDKGMLGNREPDNFEQINNEIKYSEQFDGSKNTADTAVAVFTEDEVIEDVIESVVSQNKIKEIKEATIVPMQTKTSGSSSIQTQFSDSTVRQKRQENEILHLTKQNIESKNDSNYKRNINKGINTQNEEGTSEELSENIEMKKNEHFKSQKPTDFNESLGSEIFAVFNQGDLEMSLMSASATGNTTVFSETNLSYSTIGMYEQLIQNETNKSDQLTSLMKIREKALIDRTKGQIAWLELQKQKYKEKGRIMEISIIKKKQRAILMRLEKERGEILRVLKNQKLNNQKREYKLKFEDLNASTVSIKKTMKLNSTRSTEAMKAYEIESGINLEELLMKRENELKLRKENVERLVEWHQRLDKEEQEVREMEQMLVKFNLHKYENKNINKTNETELKKQKQVRKIDKSLKILQNISSTTLLDDSVTEYVSASGNQMNKLWIRLTGRTELKFDSTRKYELNKNDLENLYEEAKRVVLGEFNEAMEDLLEESKNDGEEEKEVKNKPEINKSSLSINDDTDIKSLVTIEYSENDFNSERSSEIVSHEQNEIEEETEENKDENEEEETILDEDYIKLKMTPSEEIELNLNLDSQTDSQASINAVEETGYYFDNNTEKDVSEEVDGFEEIEEKLTVEHEEKHRKEQIRNEKHTDVEEKQFEIKYAKQVEVIAEVQNIEVEEVEAVKELKKTAVEGTVVDEKEIDSKEGKEEDEINDAESELEENNSSIHSESFYEEEEISDKIQEYFPDVQETVIEHISNDFTSPEEEEIIKSSSSDEFHIKELFEHLSEISNNPLIEDMSFPNFDNYHDYSASDVFKVDESGNIMITNEQQKENSDNKENSLDSNNVDGNKTIFNKIQTDTSSSSSFGLDSNNVSEIVESISPSIERNDIEQRLIILDESLKDVNKSFENIPNELKSPELLSPKSPRSPKSDGPDWNNKSIEMEIIEMNNKTFNIENEIEEIEEEVDIRETSSSIGSSNSISSLDHIKIEIKLKNENVLVEKETVPPTPIISLPKKQIIQTEQQIKQTEPVIILREFPNKPPPPYISPAVFPSEIRITEIVLRRTKELYEEQFLDDKENHTQKMSSSILNENTTNIYERIILDICKESVSELRNPDIKVSFKQIPTYKNKLAFYNPPDRLEAIQQYILKRVNKLLSVENRGVRPTTVHQGGSSRRKKDLVDEILAQEMMEEESKWTNFDYEEIEMKNQITDDIMKLLLGEALKDMELAFNKKDKILK